MTENQEDPFFGLSNPEVKVNPIIAHKHLKSKVKTAQRIFNEHAKDESVSCMPLDVAERLLNEKVKHETLLFYQEHTNYLLNADKKFREYEAQPGTGLVTSFPKVEEFARPVFDFVVWMENTRKPVLCVETTHVKEALELACLKVQSSLRRKHILDLPDSQHTAWLEKEFEAMCAKLKIPRRTRAIIEKRKALNEAEVLDNANENEQEGTHDLETK